MYEARSLARKAMTRAISSERPMRPNIDNLWQASTTRSGFSSSDAAQRSMGVSMAPGQTQLTRMLSAAKSSAIERVRPSSACLLTTYAIELRCAVMDCTDPTITMDPPPRRIMCGMAYLEARNALRTLARRLEARLGYEPDDAPLILLERLFELASQAGPGATDEIDRKSTRLNSSHLGIS